MAKIVIDARRIRTTTGRYAHELVKHLETLSASDGGNEERETRNEYHVVIHDKDQGVWAPSVDNFYLHVTKYDHYTFGEQLGFARFLYGLNADLVHFTMPQQPLLYFGKRITTIHDLTLVRFKNLDKNRLVYWIEQTIFKLLLKNVARRSSVVITPSKFVKKEVAEYCRIPEGKIKVTYEAASDLGTGNEEREMSDEPNSELRTPSSQLQGKQFILYVGNAFPHKNLYRLADAHELLREKHPVLHLVFAGKTDFFQEQLGAYIEEQNYRHVHQLGYVSDKQLSWLYDHAKAYVFPSLSEGFGLPGLEAMQHQTPLISSNATSLPEIYGDAAHYFDPLDTADIARAIDEVIRSKTRQEKLVAAGQTQLEKYSWLKTAEKTAKQYEAVLGNEERGMRNE